LTGEVSMSSVEDIATIAVVGDNGAQWSSVSMKAYNTVTE